MPNREGNVERRFLPIATANLELRDAEPGKKPELDGYASVFNTETTILDLWREEVAPGAFAKTIQEADIRALFNHDPNVVLGRNKAGTLALLEDAVGLRAVIQPPDSEWGRPVVEAVRRRDITGMSITFRPIKQEWYWPDRKSQELPKRTLRECKLFDVSPVTFPAFEQTSISARSLGFEVGEEDEVDLLLRARQLVRISQRGYVLTAGDRDVIREAAEVLRSCVPAGEPTGQAEACATSHSPTARTSEPGPADGDHSEEARVGTWNVRLLRLKLAEIAGV